MFTVIGLMLGGMCIGFLLRRRQLTGIHQIITVLIWILLFLLGIEVGENRQIIEGFATLGLEALAITITAVIGSSLAAWALWKSVYKRKRRAA